jgi:hypothetical protein
MAISRYRNLNLINKKYLESCNSIAQEDLDRIQCINIRTTGEDRLDVLAHKYLGDSRILVCNCHIE